MPRKKKILAAAAAIMMMIMCMPGATAARYIYDDLNRLTEVRYTSTLKVIYEYDSAGNLLKMTRQDTSPKTIKFNTNGGSVIADVSVDYGEKLVLEQTPEKAGFTFAGWYTDGGLTKAYDFDSPVYKSMTLYARWAEKAYTVSFDAASAGTQYTARTMVNGEEYANLPSPEMPGREFLGWETASGKEIKNGDTAELTDDITLYAKWQTADEYKWYYENSQSAYCIRTAAELRAFASLINSGVTFAGKTVTLGGNINISGAAWSVTGAFRGTFDGCAYEISGMQSASGFFSELSAGGIIKDLKLKGTVSGGENGGSMAVINRGLIINCRADVDVSGCVKSGGLVCVNASGGRIINCHICGDVSGSAKCAGIACENSGEMRICVFSGDIDMTADLWATVTTSNRDIENVKNVYYKSVYSLETVHSTGDEEDIDEPFAFGDRLPLGSICYYYLPKKLTMGYALLDPIATATNRAVDRYNSQNPSITAKYWTAEVSDEKEPCEIIY